MDRFEAAPFEARHDTAWMRQHIQRRCLLINCLNDPTPSREHDQAVLMHGKRNRQAAELVSAGDETPLLRALEHCKEVARLDQRLSGRPEHEDSVGSLFDYTDL